MAISLEKTIHIPFPSDEVFEVATYGDSIPSFPALSFEILEGNRLAQDVPVRVGLSLPVCKKQMEASVTEFVQDQRLTIAGKLGSAAFHISPSREPGGSDIDCSIEANLGFGCFEGRLKQPLELLVMRPFADLCQKRFTGILDGSIELKPAIPDPRQPLLA